MPEELKPGVALESWCTKCREMRAHVVVSAPQNGKLARVLCDVCSGEHNYRPSPPQSRRSSSTRKTTPRRKPGVSLTDAQKASARPYDLKGIFKQGEVINHPTFGYGQVSEIRSEQRMMVEFDSSEKQLVYNLAPAEAAPPAASS